jgi:pyruvate/2-oxoglutarate dehydrogenase complex dihydrolipoamide dehydrogenase (E3) component
MTVEYDLIVIGGSPAGTYAALTAARLNARVALVEPQQVQKNWLNYGATYTQALAWIGHIAQQLGDAPQMGIHCFAPDSTKQSHMFSVQLTEAMQWAQAVVDTCLEQNSPVILGSLGVDVMIGQGEFCRRPHLGFVVNNRRLRARTYLIATGSRPEVPSIDGLNTIDYFTPSDLWQEERVKESRQGRQDEERGEIVSSSSPSSVLSSSLSPKSRPVFKGNWFIIGGSPMSLELAQALVRLNCEVTLAVSTAQILPYEDPEASHWLQAQLEAEKIRVLTQSPVTQVRRIDEKIWVQAGDRAIEADAILLATGQQPHIETLNLEAVGVKFSPQGLVLNEKLQTTNPRIYACRDGVGDYPYPHFGRYEASIALKNALFAPLFKVDYRCIPHAIFCDPQVAQVGLTEAQARQKYGKDVFVVRQYFKTLEKAQISAQTSGFCKIIGRQNGIILGASIVGVQASELIGAIALAMQQKIKVKTLANLPHVSPTWSEIIHQTALEWQQQRYRRNNTLHHFLEVFFNLRRNWSS